MVCCLIKSEYSYQERYKKAKQVAEETPDANFVSDLEDLVLSKPQEYQNRKHRFVENLNQHLEYSMNIKEHYKYFPKYMEKGGHIHEEESMK